MTMIRHEDMVATTNPDASHPLPQTERPLIGRYLIGATLRIGILALLVLLLVALNF